MEAVTEEGNAGTDSYKLEQSKARLLLSEPKVEVNACVFFFRMCKLMMSFGSRRWFRAPCAGAGEWYCKRMSEGQG